MADLLTLSSRIVDSGVADEPVNRVTQELSELGPGLALVESFSHVVALASDAGLVLFDTSGVHTAGRVVESLRRWSRAPVHTILYTHGHVDHVGGCGALLEDAAARGSPRPRIVGHENVAARFARYAATNGYNLAANRRQFGGVRVGELGIGGVERFLPPATAAPALVFRDRLELEVGGVRIELRHARGETDDHLFAWIPERRILCSGDFFLWFFPNAGNPQKVQRYAVEWAAALREMAALAPELLLPGHGLPIAGAARVREALLDTAAYLESLVRQTLERLNAGDTVYEILQSVRPPAELAAKPYLRPVYDEPDFIVRNLVRCFGGWYSGIPSELKPAPRQALAREVLSLSGGIAKVLERANALLAAGDAQLAAHFADWAMDAEPASREVHALRAAVYNKLLESSSSTMSKGIYGAAARESAARANKIGTYPISS